jgi:hypothetical protein
LKILHTLSGLGKDLLRQPYDMVLVVRGNVYVTQVVGKHESLLIWNKDRADIAAPARKLVNIRSGLRKVIVNYMCCQGKA